MQAEKELYIVLYGLAFIAIHALFFSSCLSEPARKCPPVYRISLNVTDKNYFNISDISQIQPKDESQPFRAYIGDLTYQLQHLENQETVIELSPSLVESDEQSYTINVSDIPEGKYLLTALGNIDKIPLLRETIIPLHANNQEQFDTYFGHDTLTLSESTSEYTLAMNRTKGLLVILVENAPDSLSRVDEQISHVGQYIDRLATPSGDISVNKSFTQVSSPSATLSTFTAPTLAGKKSTLRLSLFAKDKVTPYSILPDLEFTTARNEISVVKLNFTPDGIEIWMYLYGSWQKLHNLDITL